MFIFLCLFWKNELRSGMSSALRLNHVVFDNRMQHNILFYEFYIVHKQKQLVFRNQYKVHVFLSYNEDGILQDVYIKHYKFYQNYVYIGRYIHRSYLIRINN